MKPGYKQTEVGVIPEEWESVKAGDIGRFRGGNGFPLRFQGETASGYPFYKVSDMNNEGNDTFMFDSNNWISEGTRKQLGATAFPVDSIIFAKVGAAVFLERKKILTKPSCIDNNLCALVLDKSRTHVRFVHYSLLNIKFGALVSTTALPSLSGTVLSQISFALPPLPEQRAIATALSDVDGLLGALDRLIAKKRDLKLAAMQQLLTGQTRLPGFKGEWVVAVLGDLLTMKATYGIVTAGDFKIDGVPMMRGGDIKGGQVGYDLPFVSPEKSSEYSRTVLKRNDVVIALVGYPGEAAKVPVRLEGANISRAVGLLRLNKLIEPDYLVSYLNSPMGRRMVMAPSAGSAQLVVNLAALNKLEFPLPPLPEQTAIASVLSDMDAELAGLEQRREKTRALKQGMMQELLTGRTRLV